MKASTVLVSLLGICLTGVQAGVVGRVADIIPNGTEEQEALPTCNQDSDCHLSACSDAACVQVLRSFKFCECP
ncbi:hypothetical protein F5B19DRAFT_471051 [Rostrohypoxylon terebratum]|nr:hypothetical protein F5B19DRAFT_471051 [Rostrohypoxylon terebratum]